MIGLLIAGLLLLVAAGGSNSSGKKLPAGVTENERAVLCTLKLAKPLSAGTVSGGVVARF